MTPLHADVLDIADISRSADVLADLLDAHDPSTPVRTCGDWTLADLVWHLTEVQLFWGHIIGNRPAGPDSYEAPVRPPDNALAQQLRTVGRALIDLLADAEPENEAWSWSDDHTVGFTVRRQVHESLIHSIDGVLAVGSPMTELSPLLAADGIDELVGVMLTGTPDWATFEATGDVVELRTTDSGDRWVLRAGTVSGVEPTSRKRFVLSGYERDDDAVPTAIIDAPALDLLLWMWGRREAPPFRKPADAEAASELRAVVIETTQ